MDASLLDQLQAKLADPDLDERLRSLVLAACLGPDALAAAVAGEAPGVTPEGENAGRQSTVFLAGITVEGFRGIGPKAEIMFQPGPGLTLVVGRNGSGKSSFAEGLEVLLTGANMRWEQRHSAWKNGWRNLHQSETSSVGAEVYMEGHSEPTIISRSWQPGAAIDESVDAVQLPGATAGTLEWLKWGPALDNYRPFLSYNELGSMLEDRPSDLHDAMAAFLGLDGLISARELLRATRLEKQKPAKGVKKAKAAVLDRLANASDERACKAKELLEKRTLDLEALRTLAQVADSGDGDELAALANLSGPDVDLCERAADALASAIDAAAAVTETDAGKAGRMAALLASAHQLHEETGSQDCPVCFTPGALAGDWSQRSEQLIEQLEADAAASKESARRLDDARRAARTAVSNVPQALRQTSEVASVAAALEAWEVWSSSPASDVELVTHLRKAPEVLAKVQAVRAEAGALMTERDLNWRPHARAISNWLDAAEEAATASAAAKEIEAAERWLQAAIGDVRTERFAPIADRSRHLWELLRHRSNVQLEQVALEGSNTNRHVSLEVTVDGVPSAALGVMSQGELHALALSLFLPRATMEQSPFRFVMIDDPVQAMDPARVDGLATVLEEIAKTHQVIVFTHDDRLPESVRRLGIAAEVTEVARQPGSKVTTRPVEDPVRTALSDAYAIARTEDMSDAARRKVVPVYCRLALEAAAAAKVRRRCIGRGDSHTDVEKALVEAKSLRDLVALALFDDSRRRQDVNHYLDEHDAREGKWVLHACNEGAHGEFKEDPMKLQKATETMIRRFLVDA